jgi:ATP/maltotriose-dependent transcriptional regulator MalT
MTDSSAVAGPRAGAARPGLIDRHDLVAALDHAAGKRVTIISAPAGSGKTSLLRAWAGRSRQDRRIAFMSVNPGQHDAHLDVARVYAATTPPDRQFRLRMAIASLDLLSARLRGR